jgi:hypothetical protein
MDVVKATGVLLLFLERSLTEGFDSWTIRDPHSSGFWPLLIPKIRWPAAAANLCVSSCQIPLIATICTNGLGQPVN